MVLVTVVLCLVAAGLGYTLGRLPSESDVIEAGAALYVAETGGARTDCAAIPSDVAWIEVHCGQGDMKRAYGFSRRGFPVALSDGPGA